MVESKHQWKAWLYLAPAIVLGYGIKAADRDDRERGL